MNKCELSGSCISAQAFGHPGIEPRWTSANKEAVGTAYSSSSKIWYTISHGIINEVYYPTIDHPQTRDLQFLITDGETFMHEEKRDLKSDIRCVEGAALGYCLRSRAPDDLYSMHKDIISTPHDSCLLINARIEGSPEILEKLKVYALLAPHLEIGGAGNSARRIRVAGSEIFIVWKGGTYLAMGSFPDFLESSCGFAGYSDGWQDLSQNFKMDWSFEQALDGNIAIMARMDLSHDHEFTLAVSFGQGQHAAVTSLRQALSDPFADHQKKFVQQWKRSAGKAVPLEKHSGDGGRLYRISHGILTAHEDKTYPGAFIASASIPWGEARGDEDLGGYHLVWTRDMVNTVSALYAAGDEITPRRSLTYLACSQRSDGGFHQNFWIDGTPYWGGIQLDEVAFPVILAWRLWKDGNLGLFDPYDMVVRAAYFMIKNGPMTQQERWEENSGYSPSTLASNIAALICAADFALARNHKEKAAFMQEYADFLKDNLIPWTVTTAGTLLPEIPRHFIRINPTDINDPSPMEEPDDKYITLANSTPGEEYTYLARNIVDAGFLELVRYGIFEPEDPLIQDSLRVVDKVLKVDTPFGPCWRRYNNDGYGQRADGGPFLGHGKGRAWPLLTGERGHFELAAGNDPGLYIRTMEGFASAGGMLPEQVWDEADQGKMKFGRATGAVTPLCWAHAEYIKLLRSARDERVFDQIPIVAQRYLGKARKSRIQVWKPVRQIKSIKPGTILRIQNPRAFIMRWTRDEWQHSEDVQSSPSGLGIGFVDIPVSFDQKAPLRFTFFWPDTDSWEGRDYQVMISSS